MGRKCIIKEISKENAFMFLETNHIEGGVVSTVYIGAYSNDELVGVEAFTNNGKDKWILTRIATSNYYRSQGVASKMFKYFIKKYNPLEIISFADRRWVLTEDDNLYIKLGFRLNNILEPDYKYYSSKLDRYKRFNKFDFNPKTMEEYRTNENLTRDELIKKLKIDRIWDCGMYKFVWEKVIK